MDQPILVRMAEALAREGALVLRFNFVYSDTGRRSPDRPPVLIATWRARPRGWPRGPRRRAARSCSAASRWAGASPRTWRRSATAATGCGSSVTRSTCGPAEEAARRHLADVPCPMLFLAGTRDPLCDLALLRPVLSGWARARRCTWSRAGTTRSTC
jgi:hypothetical protein